MRGATAPLGPDFPSGRALDNTTAERMAARNDE
jgi:hypothetical protein